MTSTRITCRGGRVVRASSIPAVPEAAVATSQPAVNSSVRRTSMRRSGSSSMISARKGSTMGCLCWPRSPILTPARDNDRAMVPTIYILDDDVVYAKLLAANLGSPGRVRTRVFGRPDASLAHHADEPADAIITDLVMPDLNGVEVTRRLRRADPHIPIFVLTGHGDIATAIEALKAGATEYLTKPVNIDELMTLLTRA